MADDIADRVRAMLSEVSNPRVLVVGGGDTGAGMHTLLDDPTYTVIESDIYFGPRTNLIADGHNLPFYSNTFDAVICQAVLEHVVRPQACIDEIHRVLKPHGVFFADIPFMYPVHMGPYDFTRFSLGGLRLACRAFEEEDAGVSNGPLGAVAQTIFHSARTLSSSRIWRVFVWFGLPWLIFWLPHLDKLLRNRPQVSDAASGVYFVGRKSDRVRGEREIIRQHWSYHVQKKRKLAGVKTSEVTEPVGALKGTRRLRRV
jgi:SAM-dependent methyltransferase